MTQPHVSGVDGEGQLSLRHVGLVGMLVFVAMCEGYDIALTTVVLPYAGKAYGVDSGALGNALAVIGLGAILAWMTLRLADRFGRRPVLIASAAGFGLGSLLTMLAPDLQTYTAIQTVARMLMITQIALSYLVLSETLPPRLRGRANGILGASGSLGAALPFFFLDMALASPLGWKALFLIGAAPLFAVPFLWLWLRETPVYLHARSAGSPRATVLDEFRALTGKGLRPRFAAMSAMWLIVNFASLASAAFFTLYVVQERGWSPAQLAALAPGIMIGALAGNVIAGVLMDWLGRRLAMSVLLACVGGMAQLCYYATDPFVIAAAWVVLQSALGIWVVGFTINAELFPTHLRASANGWCNSLIGRWGMVLAPLALGYFSQQYGAIGPVAATLGGVAFLGIPLVWFAVPETRAANLERIVG